MRFFWNHSRHVINQGNAFIPVVIFAGQSNDAGRAETSRLPLTQYSVPVAGTVKIFYRTNYNTSTIGTWQDYSPGVNSAEPDLMGFGYTIFGKEISLAAKLYERFGTPIYVIKTGDGGTCLNNNGALRDWYPTNTGECFTTARDYIQQGLAALETANPGVEIRVAGVSWHQGESDCQLDGGGNPTGVTLAYTTNFAVFETAFRAIDSRLSTAPIFVHNLRFYDPVLAAEAYINSAMSTYCSSHSNCYYIDTQVPYMRKVDLPNEIKIAYPNSGLGDDDHNSYQYQIRAGELIYEKMVDIGILD